MTTMKDELVDLEEDAADVAAGWFSLQRSGRMSAADEAELQAWLEADAGHLAAWRKVEQTWTGTEAARTHPDVLALREQVLQRRAQRWSRRGRLLRPPAIAAALAVAILGAGLGALLLGERFGPAPQAIEQQFRTSVGQRTTMTLPDGSVVTLDTDTVVRTHETARERRVELQKGQAFFKVAKDASRPFVVVAGDRRVTALGTAFSVRLDRDRFQLTMVEGKVKVEAPLRLAGARRLQAANMTAGSQLVATADRQWTIRPVDAEKASGWTRGMLIYERTPLSVIADELNRYSEKKIVISDPEAAARRVNGAFRADDLSGAVEALESYGLVRVTGQTDSTIELASLEKMQKSQDGQGR